jgi:hypothetical protein
MNSELDKINAIPIPKQIPFDLQPLLNAFNDSKVLSPIQKTTLTQLNDLNEDLRFFNANKDNKLRRDIDLDVLYHSPHSFLMGG